MMNGLSTAFFYFNLLEIDIKPHQLDLLILSQLLKLSIRF